jgi:putative flippase GtrA
MKVFLKANAASAIASLFDYAVAIVLKELFIVQPFTASILGTITGGIINFFICRYWVFSANGSSIYFQSKRYLLAWAGNLLLSALGVYLLLGAGLNYVLAKLITSVMVVITYNYPLQKKYVFKNN